MENSKLKKELVESVLSADLNRKIAEFYSVDPNDRAAMAASCGALLELENSWNADSLDPVGHLEKCFAGDVHTPFYARHKHPEGETLEAKYAELHAAQFSLATVSGEAAIALVINTLTRSGDRLLVSEKIFGTTKNNFRISQAQDGREVIFTDLHDYQAWKEKITQYRPRLVFIESPSNPLAELGDVQRLKNLLGESGATLVVDSTYAPAVIYQPLQLGADVVIESATKFMDGQTKVTGGMIATDDKVVFDALFKVRNAKGLNQVSFNALSLEYNLRSLESRVRKQSENAWVVANLLAGHEAVEEVLYLGLSTHPQHQLAKKDFNSYEKTAFGSMIGFKVKGCIEATKQVANKTGFDVRANLGSVKTIITHPITSTHSQSRLSIEDIEAAGVTPNLLRLSVGLETPESIINQLNSAFTSLSN